MAPLPKRRHSTRRSGKRERIQLIKNAVTTIQCVKCKSPKLTHRACPKCGFYK